MSEHRGKFASNCQCAKFLPQKDAATSAFHTRAASLVPPSDADATVVPISKESRSFPEEMIWGVDGRVMG